MRIYYINLLRKQILNNKLHDILTTYHNDWKYSFQANHISKFLDFNQNSNTFSFDVKKDGYIKEQEKLKNYLDNNFEIKVRNFIDYNMELALIPSEISEPKFRIVKSDFLSKYFPKIHKKGGILTRYAKFNFNKLKNNKRIYINDYLKFRNKLSSLDTYIDLDMDSFDFKPNYVLPDRPFLSKLPFNNSKKSFFNHQPELDLNTFNKILEIHS